MKTRTLPTSTLRLKTTSGESRPSRTFTRTWPRSEAAGLSRGASVLNSGHSLKNAAARRDSGVLLSPEFVSAAFLAGISTLSSKKPAFLRFFLRFLLAFPVFLGL
jgi:hypothetical protein